MNEIRKFRTAFSRALYTRMRREAKCPPVIAVRFAHFGWYVEMKDGSFSIETVSTSTVSDVWEAKCKCIEGWLEQNSRKAK